MYRTDYFKGLMTLPHSPEHDSSQRLGEFARRYGNSIANAQARGPLHRAPPQICCQSPRPAAGGCG